MKSMQKIILKIDKYNKYEPMECEGNTIWLLENFLHDIIMHFFSSYIELATNPNEDQLETNSVCLTKKNDIIAINSLFSDEADGGPFFKISIDQFVKLLKEWERLVNAKAQKITITEDNGIITIEGE